MMHGAGLVKETDLARAELDAGATERERERLRARRAGLLKDPIVPLLYDRRLLERLPRFAVRIGLRCEALVSELREIVGDRSGRARRNGGELAEHVGEAS